MTLEKNRRRRQCAERHQKPALVRQRIIAADRGYGDHYTSGGTCEVRADCRLTFVDRFREPRKRRRQAATGDNDVCVHPFGIGSDLCDRVAKTQRRSHVTRVDIGIRSDETSKPDGRLLCTRATADAARCMRTLVIAIKHLDREEIGAVSPGERAANRRQATREVREVYWAKYPLNL